jgi:peptide chain release factor subunit 3
MPLEDRNINGPFMLPISEKYNELGTIAVGKIESGRVKKGDQLLLMPNKVTVEVSGVFSEQSEEIEQAYHGDNIRIRLKGVTDDEVMPGFVLTSLQKPVKAVTRFEAQIHIIDTKNIICSGYSAVLHVHTLAEEVTLTVSHSLDRKTLLLTVKEIARLLRQVEASPSIQEAASIRKGRTDGACSDRDICPNLY